MKKSVYVKLFLLLISFFILTALISCSKKGLVSENLSKEIYSVPNLMPDGPYQKNPTFIIYGDTRPGYRLFEKFLKKKNWYTPKMLLFPFYEIYLAGNGLIGGINYLRNDSNYNYDKRIMVRDAVYNEAKKSHVDFILNMGDLVNDGRYPDHWRRFLVDNKIKHPLLNEIPYIPIFGSHECPNDKKYGIKNLNVVFKYPGFHVMEFPDADLFVIDSNIILDHEQFIDDETQDKEFDKWFVSNKESGEISWLEKKLAASKKTFKIVSMHHPPISFGKHHNDWDRDDYGKYLPEKRKRLLKLFQKYGVQIVFSSHEHLYEHNILRYTKDRNNIGEIHIIISGGGGAPLRDETDPESIQEYLEYFRNEGLDVIQVKNEKIYHYCRVSINADQIKIDVNEVKEEAEKPFGFRESFIVRKQ